MPSVVPELAKRKWLSSRPPCAVMLLTKMSKRPSPLTSPKSTPIPLNESLPSTIEVGMVKPLRPWSRFRCTFPGVDSLR
jgi:hypothetical protein